VAVVLDDLRDYKRGALGCALDLDAPRLDALRAAEDEDEQASWESDLYDLPGSGGPA
jgi:hypothetical protein